MTRDCQVTVPPSGVPVAFWIDGERHVGLAKARRYLTESVGLSNLDAMEYIKSLPVVVETTF